MDGSMFHEMTYDRKLIKSWPFFDIDEHSHYRLYYNPDSPTEKTGFSFVFVAFVSCSSCESKTWWDDESSELEVEANLYGVARFDGLRHVWSNSNSNESNLNKLKPDGYVYCQSSDIMIRVYEKLKELESLYCSSVDPIKLVK